MNGEPAQPLSALPEAAWRRVVGIMTDIDDTLTADLKTAVNEFKSTCK